MHYPGKIVAIPGNHDGEIYPKTDPLPLKAFLQNFCATSAKVPPIAGSIYRETMTQPGVYSSASSASTRTRLKIPGSAQKQWLISALRYVKGKRTQGTRKGLIIATHHPPFSQGGHSGSSEMLSDIDDAC